jgi:hypothetical protein
MKRTPLIALALLASAGMAVAHADIWQDVYRDLGYFVTPTGSPVQTTNDGFRVNGARSGRLRIVPNGVFGGGYRVELDRTFGADATGRPEVFRFGTLGSATLSGSIQGTAGYDSLGKSKSGFANLTVSNLNYDIKTKLGVQDAELTGTLNVSDQLQANVLGFYDVTVNVSNANSKLVLDGVVVSDTTPTNFDVGPIVVHGNLLVDATAALLTLLGVDATTLEEMFPASAISQIDTAIQAQMQAASAVAGTTAENDMASLLVQSVLGRDSEAANTLIQGVVDGTISGNGESAHSSSLLVPEPGTLVLLALGASTAWYWRRRQG